MTKLRFDFSVPALALLTCGVLVTSTASAAIRHDGIATAVLARPATTEVRMKHHDRRIRRHRQGRSHSYGSNAYYGSNTYGAPQVGGDMVPMRYRAAPTPAPSYCAGQFQNASPDGLFRDNVGRIRPCF